MIRLAAAALAVLFTGCGIDTRAHPKPVIIAARTVPPVVETRVVEKDGGIPSELLADCYDEPAKEISTEEAKRLAELRRKSIADCNRVKAKYRGRK